MIMEYLQNPPVKLKGKHVSPIWSGDKLSRIYSAFSGCGKIGESWETSIVTGSEAYITNCKYTNNDTVAFPEYLENIGRPVPPLVKLLDSEKPLSIQVHPDEKSAVKLGGISKSEIWYILDSEPGSYIYYGTKPEIEEKQIEDVIRNGQIEELLNRIYVKPGDVYMIPPGMIHSLGGGITVLEVQNRSGTTYRVKDIAGTRETHINESLESIKLYSLSEAMSLAFTTKPRFKICDNIIASTDDFTVFRYTSDASEEIKTICNGIYMFCVCGGGNSHDIYFDSGDSLYFPDKDSSIKLKANSTVIFVI